MMKNMSALCLVFLLIFMPRLVRGEEFRIIQCEFQGGTGLNMDNEVFKLSNDGPKFAFNLPTGWFQTTKPKTDAVKVTWKNMKIGLDGDATALLNGEMITVVEISGSDNGFYVAVWPNKEN